MLAASILKTWRNPLSDQRGRDLVNIPMTPLPSVPEAATTPKIRRAAEGSWGSTKLQKSRRKLVQRKQRGAASDNAYNCPIIAVSEFCLSQIITPELNKRATPNLQRTVRWMCNIDGRSRPLLQLYNFCASMYEYGWCPIIDNLLYNTLHFCCLPIERRVYTAHRPSFKRLCAINEPPWTIS